MFRKFASNILNEISEECLLKSFSSANEQDRELYGSISSRIDWLVRRINIEEMLKSKSLE